MLGQLASPVVVVLEYDLLHGHRIQQWRLFEVEVDEMWRFLQDKIDRVAHAFGCLGGDAVPVDGRDPLRTRCAQG